MGAWCSCSRSQEIVLTTPKDSPILRPSSGTFEFPPPLIFTNRLTTIPEDEESIFETKQKSMLKSHSNTTPRTRSRVKFAMPPGSGSQNTSYQPQDWSQDESDPYYENPSMSLDRCSRSTRYGSHDMSHVANPPTRLSHDHRYTGNDISSSLLYKTSDSDLITVTLLQSSRVFSSGCGLPVIIEGSGFNAAKALQVHNILYVMHYK